MQKRAAALLLTSLLAGLALAGCHGGTFTVPSTIDNTCGDDVTTPLNNWLGTLPASNIHVVFPSGCYRVEGVIEISNKSGWYITGTGAPGSGMSTRIRADTDGAGAPLPSDSSLHASWPRQRKHFFISRSNNMDLGNFTINGPNVNGGANNNAYNPALEGQHGVEVIFSTQIRIHDIEVKQVYGDGVRVSGNADSPANNSDQVDIYNMTIHHNGRQGITIDHGTNVRVHDSNLYEIARTTFDLEPGPGGNVQQIEIDHNQVGLTNGIFFSSGGRGYVGSVNVHHNTATGEPLKVSVADSDGDPRGPHTVSDNTSDFVFGSPVALMDFRRVQGLRAERNSNPIATTQSRLAIYAFNGKGYNAQGQLVCFNNPAFNSVKDNSFPGAVNEFTFDYGSTCNS